jgi:hypothetical protein
LPIEDFGRTVFLAPREARHERNNVVADGAADCRGVRRTSQMRFGIGEMIEQTLGSMR